MPGPPCCRPGQNAERSLKQWHAFILKAGIPALMSRQKTGIKMTLYISMSGNTGIVQLSVARTGKNLFLSALMTGNRSGSGIILLLLSFPTGTKSEMSRATLFHAFVAFRIRCSKTLYNDSLTDYSGEGPHQARSAAPLPLSPPSSRARSARPFRDPPSAPVRSRPRL